jgi:hypothetical protein
MASLVKTWAGCKSAQNAMKIGRIRRLIVLIKHLTSICPYLFLLCQYGEGRRKIGTQEEMYYRNISDRPKINYTLYNVHNARKMDYFDLQNSQRFVVNRKIPVQNLANKEMYFVKAILNIIS